MYSLIMNSFFSKFCLLIALLVCFRNVRCSPNKSLCQPKCIPTPAWPNAPRCKIQEQKCFTKDHSQTTGGIAKPVRVDSDPGWYLYRTDKYDIIALNFSWKLPKGFLMENFDGFKIEIKSDKRSQNIIGYQPDTMYFCIDGIFTTIRKGSPQFNYDCYGKFGSAPVELDDYLTVHITPNSGHLTYEGLKNYSLSIGIRVPNCDDKSLSNVKTCQNSISVLKYFCNNRTVILQYTMSSWQANTATVKLCRIRSADNPRCTETLKRQSYMPLSTKAMAIEIPAETNSGEGFLVEVFSSNRNAQRLRTKINFTVACPSPESASSLPLGVILPTCVVASVALITTVLCVLKPILFTPCISDQACPRQDVAAKPKMLKGRGVDKNPPCVYIIFVDDHFKHKDIVSNFASFLQSDLEFIIVFELWDQEKLYSNYTLWLQNAMALADKILVIWSPGAKRRWELQTSTDTHQDDLYDLFTPVVIQIKKDLLRNRNVGKYFFAYFEYCSESDIPQAFHKQSFRQFKLMHQFEELYFHLKNTGNSQTTLELKQEGIAFDKSLCPNFTTFGPILKNAISDMCKYVKNNPTWHCNDKSSFNSEKGNTCEYITSDEILPTAQAKTSSATYFSDKVAVKNLHATPRPKFKSRDHRTSLHPNYSRFNNNSLNENQQDFHSLSESDNHALELESCFESSEIDHDLEAISNFSCATPGQETSAVRLSERSFIDSIHADYFTEDNFKSSSETLNSAQNMLETQQVHQTTETCEDF